LSGKTGKKKPPRGERRTQEKEKKNGFLPGGEKRKEGLKRGFSTKAGP